MRLQFDKEALERLSKIDVALLERGLSTGDEFDLAEADFFDDESIVIAYRLRGENSAWKKRLSSHLYQFGPVESAYLAMFDYSELGYLALPTNARVSTRQELVQEVIGHWSQGNVGLVF